MSLHYTKTIVKFYCFSYRIVFLLSYRFALKFTEWVWVLLILHRIILVAQKTTEMYGVPWQNELTSIRKKKIFIIALQECTRVIFQLLRKEANNWLLLWVFSYSVWIQPSSYRGSIKKKICWHVTCELFCKLYVLKVVWGKLSLPISKLYET